MATHPKVNILPKPFPFNYERITQNMENNKMMYCNQPVLCTDKEGRFYIEPSNECVVDEFCEKETNPLRAVKISSTKAKEEEEKTIIPRAEDARAKANKILTFRFINHILYLLASFKIKREINYAIKHKESHIFILNDDWRICYFPELIDRLKYLGYRVNKNIFGSYYVYWDNEYPGEEI